MSASRRILVICDTSRSGQNDRLETYPTIGSIISLIKAGNEKRERNWEPDKERRVVRVVAAAVVTSVIISALPVAPALSSVRVVSATAAIIAAVIIPAVTAMAAGMNGGMTSMGGTGLRRSNAEEGE
jgi:hypothetical protein